VRTTLAARCRLPEIILAKTIYCKLVPVRRINATEKSRLFLIVSSKKITFNPSAGVIYKFLLYNTVG